MHNKAAGEQVGRHGGRNAVHERGAGAQTDQRPHIWAAVSERLQAPGIDGEACPQDHGRR